MPTYTTTQAAHQLRAIGVTTSTIRNYTRDERFIPYFSPTAVPSPGRIRQLTDDDVRLVRFIAENSNAGVPLAEIAQRLADHELDTYTPEEPQPEEQPQQPALSLALQSVVSQLAEYQRTQAELTQALIESARDVARAQAIIDQQAQEIERLHALLGEELDRLRRGQQPRPGLLARLLGRK